MLKFPFTRPIHLLAITLLLLALARAQLIIQTPSELGINTDKLEEMLTAKDPSFPQFDMVGAQDTQGTPGSPRLAECLTVERKLSLFYEYAREVGPVMKRIVSPTEKTTLLVPVNQAIIALPHKPHQDTLDTVHVSEVKVKNNVERFVKAHTLATTIPWPPASTSPASYESMLGGGHRVSFRLVGDEVRVDPGDVKVLAMKEAYTAA
ncbi:hypothetical protein QFC20_000262 [Naganishia adeliensis]|uniref:Uncharacterized protein n=1 Tax=Naganishia adeliensis TaxID=92952 RepID=A0ACC2X2V3_9TREE|nr:hypothetical protein QFC20_000262 [Naganishia adeliensis]